MYGYDDVVEPSGLLRRNPCIPQCHDMLLHTAPPSGGRLYITCEFMASIR